MAKYGQKQNSDDVFGEPINFFERGNGFDTSIHSGLNWQIKIAQNNK